MAVTTDKSSSRWWTEPNERIADVALAYVENLENQQAWVWYCNRLNERLYSNRNPDGGFAPPAYADLLGYDVPSSKINVLSALCDTATALIASARPKCSFLSTGGTWRDQLNAREQTHYCRGLFDENDFYRKSSVIVSHATVQGTGVAKIFAYRDKPVMEVIPVDDVVVDEREARNCPPRQVHHRRFVDKDVLARLYPKYADRIRAADPTYGDRRRQQTARTTNANSIPLVESWRLPSWPGAGDGKRVLAIKGCALEVEEYEEDELPFVFFRWKEPQRGFYGVGLVELLTQLQMQLNDLVQFIEECQRLIISPKVYGDFGQKLPDEALTNEPGVYVNIRGGKAPTFYTPQALNAETYNERTFLMQQMYSIGGISEMVARARKEPGIDSGIGQREVADQQTGRLSIQSQAFEDFVLACGRRFMRVASSLARNGKPVKVSYKDRNIARSIDWSAVEASNENYVMSVEASSILGSTPAGRISRALDLLKAGAIDVGEFRHLVDIPDVERTVQELDAPRQYVEWVIERLMDGEWVRPDPVSDLQLGIQLMQRTYLTFVTKKAPNEVLDLFRRWIEIARAELVKAAAPPPMATPQMAPAPGVAPPGAPPSVVQPIAPPPPMPGIAA